MVGFLNIYKPSGMTSNKVLTTIKKKFHIDKLGHMGTLDPMACGVLPVAVGKATRMFDYFLDKKKTYLAHFEFGYTTDTLDAEGVKTEQNDVVVNVDMLKKVIPSLVGKIQQTPPNFSAKNINGVRAYKLARNGESFVLPPKEVEIHSIKVVDQISVNKFALEITCGGGTYIRSIARDIAEKMGTYGCMTFLERTESGFFKKENAVELDEINNFDSLVSIEDVFSNIPVVKPGEIVCKKICNGVIIDLDKPNGCYFIKHQDELIGVIEVVNKKAKLKTYLKD